MVATAANAINVSTGGVIAFDGTATFNSRTITAGAGITVSNGSGVSGNPTITATGQGMTWTDQSTSFNAVASNGYFSTGTLAATLPASPSEGDTIAFVATSTNVCTITGNTGQVIQLGTVSSAAAGTCASNKAGDSITLTYRSTGTTWWGRAVQGTWTIT